MTIYEIKRLTAEKAPYFFSRKAMKFFHQTLKDFSVVKAQRDIWKISAPMRDYSGKCMGMTVRYFYRDNLYRSMEDAMLARYKADTAPLSI